jgi:prevent-host-death family protein
MKIPDIIPITDLRQDAAAIFTRVQDSHEPVVVTHRGRPIAVIQSIAAYDQALRMRELVEQLLARGSEAGQSSSSLGNTPPGCPKCGTASAASHTNCPDVADQ